MMVAMMLPSLVTMRWRDRQAVGSTGQTHLGPLTALVGVGYFFVWSLFGMVAFALDDALDGIERRYGSHTATVVAMQLEHPWRQAPR